MAIKKSVATGKSSQTATWSTSSKPAAGDDIIVEGGFSVEWNTTAIRIRSIEVQSGCTLSGTAALSLGASTAGNNGVRENLLLLFAVGSTVTWKAAIEVSSTFTTTPQTITTNSKGSQEKLLIESTNTAKVRLGSALTTGNLTSNLQGGTLELNGFTASFGGFTTEGTVTLDVTGSTVKVTGNGGFSAANATLTLTGGSTFTLEMEAGAEASLNARTIGTLVIKAKAVTLNPGTEGCTVANLTVNNKGETTGNGFKITKERRLTVTGTLTTDGTEASKARIESTEAGKAAKLKLTTEQESDGIALQDIAVEGGPLYIAKGTNVSGNSEVGTTVFFEAKPVAGGPLTLGMMV